MKTWTTLFWITLTWVFSFSAKANDIFDRNDAFEYFNLNYYRASSTWVNSTNNTMYFMPEDIFGGSNGTQEGSNGHYAFADREMLPEFPTFDSVEWQTGGYVALDGYSISFRGDWAFLPDRRCSRVVLWGILDPAKGYEIIDSFVPQHDATTIATTPDNMFVTNRTLATRALAKTFRVELERDPFRHAGIRLIEIDAKTTASESDPFLQITAPESGAVVFNDSTVRFELDVDDPDGIHHVDFLVDGELLETQKTGFEFSWVQPPAKEGPYQITFTAVDKLGGQSTASTTVEVLNRDPVIRMSMPRIGEGHLHFDVTGGMEGREQVISSSTDLILWNEVKRQIYPGEVWTFSMPIESGPVRYYRVEMGK